MYISVADITFVVLPELTPLALFYSFFFFNDTATTEIYTLSLHDALPICFETTQSRPPRHPRGFRPEWPRRQRSEEHTSELQSRLHLVCRLLLEKKKAGRSSSVAGTSSPLRSRSVARSCPSWLTRAVPPAD